MNSKTNENLIEDVLDITSDDTGKSISGTDITNIIAVLNPSSCKLTISWTSMTNNDTIRQKNESSNQNQDPTPRKGITQFEIIEGASRSSSKNYSQEFDNMGDVGNNIFVWTEEGDTEKIPDTETDRGTVVPVQESGEFPIEK